MSLAIYFYGKIIGKKRKFIWSLMRSILINIGSPPGFAPTKMIGRVILLLFLFYGIILSSLFQSATVSRMTSQYYHKQISSLEEAISHDFQFMGTAYNQKVLQNQNDEVITLSITIFLAN